MINTTVSVNVISILSFLFKEVSAFLCKSGICFCDFLDFLSNLLCQLPGSKQVYKNVVFFLSVIIFSSFEEFYLLQKLQVVTKKSSAWHKVRNYNVPTSPLGAPLYIQGNCVNNYKTNFFNPIF